jgi:glutathione S-transferase
VDVLPNSKPSIPCTHITDKFRPQPYKVYDLDLSSQAQKQPWFLEINPNGRIPALTDTLQNGSPIRIFESGSILLYLAERYDTDRRISFETRASEYIEMVSSLFWQNAGLGPMQGQANHFRRYAPLEDGEERREKVHRYSLSRYQMETKRLYGVLESHLGKKETSPFLVSEKVTIADLSVLSWVLFADWAGVDIDEFPHVKTWEERVCRIPGVIRGTEVPKQTLDLRQMAGSGEGRVR